MQGKGPDDVQPPASGQVQFRQALAGCLEEVERCATSEVVRLEALVASLRTENKSLFEELERAGKPESVPRVPTPLPGEIPDDGVQTQSNHVCIPVVSPEVFSDTAPLRQAAAPPPFQAQEASPQGTQSQGSGVSKPGAKPGELRELVEKALKPKEAYDVRDLYAETGVFQQVAKSGWFEQLTLGVITVNAVWMCVDVDVNDAESFSQTHFVFVIAEFGFCAFFLSELLIRLMAFQKKWWALTDLSFVFDSVLVTMMCVEVWLMPLIQALTDTDSSGALKGASILRLFRLIRLTRITRIMRMVPELTIMVKGMLAGIRSVSIAMFLMASLTYVFAIAFRLLTDETPVGLEHFKSVPLSAYTLVIEGMLPDNGDMMTTLGEERWYLGLLFFIFIFLAALTIMNMLIGILCEVVSSTKESESEDAERSSLELRLRTLFDSIDNHDGMVSEPEFLAMLNDPGAVRALNRLGVDVFGLCQNADLIFSALGKDTLEFTEFMEMLWQYRATTAAMVKSLSDLRRLFCTRITHMERSLRGIEGRLDGGLEGRLSSQPPQRPCSPTPSDDSELV